MRGKPSCIPAGAPSCDDDVAWKPAVVVCIIISLVVIILVVVGGFIG